MPFHSIEQIILDSKFTVLLGKNGAGKSSLMRKIDSINTLNTRYISPERGGTLKYDPGVEYNIANSPEWLAETRRRNRLEQFREQSAVQFKILELQILREIEQDITKRCDTSYTFEVIIEQLNALLPAIKLVRSEKGFSILSKIGEAIEEDAISSGESELLALAIEILVFSNLNKTDKILLLDEPDVHLHPDLQQKFVNFIEKTASNTNLRIVISTHSSAVIGAFSNTAELTIIPISNRQQQKFQTFRKSDVSDKILPIFGAHPLSNVFNHSPVLLVEGEDDKRVFEQVVRSSNGKFQFSPCVVGNVNEMAYWEDWLSTFLPVLYDEPRSYSLRDLDSSPDANINNVGCVCRLRLNCYSIENILLTDECFIKHKSNAKNFKEKLKQWQETYPDHKYYREVSILIDNFENRRTLKIKNIRNIIIAILESNKPWEVIVGQLIVSCNDKSDSGKHSVTMYLGDKIMTELLKF